MILEESRAGGFDPTPDHGAADCTAIAQGFGADVQQAVGLGNDPGLGLLLDLAKKGEYDPWDLDIVAVTDSYLAALDEHLDPRDLGRVARLIFYAAALIHLKAKALADRQAFLDYEEALEQTLAEELDLLEGSEGGPRLRPGDMPLDYGFMGPGGNGLLAPSDRPVRPQGLTLADLISALRDYDDRHALREAELEAEPLFDAGIALDECVGSSHEDDLDQDVIDVRLELWGLLAEDGGLDRAALEQLVTDRRSKSATYLALLFLAQDEEILLDQESFYDGPVMIVRGPYFGEIRAGVSRDDDDEDEERTFEDVVAELTGTGAYARGSEEEEHQADDEGGEA